MNSYTEWQRELKARIAEAFGLPARLISNGRLVPDQVAAMRKRRKALWPRDSRAPKCEFCDGPTPCVCWHKAPP